jgi:hypothetical protein
MILTDGTNISELLTNVLSSAYWRVISAYCLVPSQQSGEQKWAGSTAR